MMNKEQAIATQTEPQRQEGSPALLARREMLSRMLNAYLRETGQHTPLVSPPRLPGITLAIHLHATGQTLYGSLLHHSAAGHHVYGDKLYTADIEHLQPNAWRPLSFEQITSLLLEEISSAELQSASHTDKKSELEQMVYNSLMHMTSYLEHALKAGPPLALSFRFAEQALLCGHPFHPTPKSLEGFSAADSRAYSPEYGTGFKLCCFAAAPELVAEDWLDWADGASAAPWVSAEMTEAAHHMLSAERKHYMLLPCHPWQATYLRSLDSVQLLLQQGLLIDLGSTGPYVYPTSSVRTVWNPKEGCFYKLSLHIRITNFIRENTEEQLLRTLDASRIVAAVKDRWKSDSFQILLEKGYRTLQAQGVDPVVRAQLISGFSMIVREAPEACNASGESPYVVASLMEVLPGEAEPLLLRAVRESLQARSDKEDGAWQTDWLAWFRQYVELSMVPILQWYGTFGISLEAHVQNAMLSLVDGMPAAFFVRDLEGISVDRSLAEQQGWVGSIVQSDSPVLYAEEQARHRLKYYFFVNHLSHVVQRLAYYTSRSEQPFWSIIRETLIELRDQPQTTARLRSMIHDLLETPTLPAKANLLSRFHQRGETPLYVDIPNPIRMTN